MPSWLDVPLLPGVLHSTEKIELVVMAKATDFLLTNLMCIAEVERSVAVEAQTRLALAVIFCSVSKTSLVVMYCHS